MTTTAEAPVTASDQSAALRTLLTLAEQHPTLPGAYLVISSITPDEVGAQLDGPSELEAWREALHLPSDHVRFSALGDRWQLRLRTQIGGVTICLYAAFSLTAEIPGCTA